MKLRGYCLAALSVVTLLAPGIGSPLPATAISTHHQFQRECEEVLTQALEAEYIDQLANPIITTAEELAERQEIYLQLHQCLEGGLSSITAEWIVADLLAQYFLVIVGGMDTPAGASELYIVDLSTTQNLAVKQLREEVGVEPPSGYVFVRHYFSREAMPDLVRRAFEDESTVGATMLSRYIAILAEDQGSSVDVELQLQSLPKTVSHELIHAYVNSIIGIDKSAKLPTWYKEGLAIYFSGSGQSSYVYLAPNITISTVSPEDYEQYELNFKYLEAKLGREQLLAQIKLSIETTDPAVLYRDLDIPSDNWLAASARAWQKNENAKIRKWGLLAVGLLALIIIGLISMGKPGDSERAERNSASPKR